MMIKPTIPHHKLMLLAIICAAAASWWQTGLYGLVKGDTSDFTAAEIISVSNAARQENGLAPLKPQDQLMNAAAAKARAMLTANSWAHDTPTQTSGEFIDNSGYVYVFAGENLAKNFTSAQNVVAAWLNSPSHRENLLNPEFNETGVAVVEGNYQQKAQTTLVVQYLAKAMATPSATQNPTISQLDILENNPLSPFLYFAFGCSAALLFGGAMIFFSQKSTHHRNKLSVPAAIHWRR